MAKPKPEGWQNRIVGYDQVDPESLLANPRNWRIHPGQQQDALESVLDTVGWVDDVIVNRRTGFVVDGHLRVSLALRRSEKSVPVKFVELTDQEEALVLATLDPIGAMAASDKDKMAELMASIATDDQALLETINRIARHEGTALRRLAPTADANGDLEAVQKKWGVASGQHWILGRHRVVCGDARDVRLMEGLDVPGGVVITDPPYNSGGFQEAGRSAGTFGKIASDQLSTRGHIALLTQALKATQPRVAYIFTDWRQWNTLWDVVESSGLPVRSMIVWDKGTPGLGGLWRSEHELIMFSSRDGLKREKGSPAMGNVLHAERSGNVHHYTEKPIDLLRQLVSQDGLARPKATICDPFMGSGSTLLAAELEGRSCIGIEIEPGYVAVTLERWHTMTGETPILESETASRHRPAKRKTKRKGAPQ
jgi:DNA modification methylase